jgi:beta-lactam-binding protein with PASTA domain
MPDVRGLPLRQALDMLSPFGLRIQLSGRGIVVDQLPAPGSTFDAETTVRLTLAPPSGPRARTDG